MYEFDETALQDLNVLIFESPTDEWVDFVMKNRTQKGYVHEYDLVYGPVASAGGHLTASLATLYSSVETRPAFQILFYPVITMTEGITHHGSRENLLGKNPSDEDVLKYSLENQVNAQTAQAFFMLSADDDTVPAENSIAYSRALIASKVPVAMYMYPTGGHGWGYRDDFKYKRQWTGELEKWLRERIQK